MKPFPWIELEAAILIAQIEAFLAEVAGS